MDQRKPDRRRGTSLEAFEIFLRDDEKLKKNWKSENKGEAD